MEQSSSHNSSSRSSSNGGGGGGGDADEKDGRGSSEWEVVSLSLSSHSLAASDSFETVPGFSSSHSLVVAASDSFETGHSLAAAVASGSFETDPGHSWAAAASGSFETDPGFSSSRSLAASAASGSFETDPGRRGGGGGMIGDGVVDVSLQSNYFVFPSLSSSSSRCSSEAEEIQKPTASDVDDDDDDDDDGADVGHHVSSSSLITKLDVDSGEKKAPVAAVAAATTTISDDVVISKQGLSQEVLAAVEYTARQEEAEEKKEEDLPLLVVSSCTSDMQELLEMNWSKEPLPSGMLRHAVVDFGEHKIGSSTTSLLYALTPESKTGSQPDFGPLLGSCLSTPSSSPAIISRSNSLRPILGEELCQSQLVKGDPRKEDPDRFVAEGGAEEKEEGDQEQEQEQEGEVWSLAGGFERARNSDVEFCDSDDVAAAGRQFQKVELDKRKSSEAALRGGGDGCSAHTCEAWWKRHGILWYVQAQQATTLWSLALAAAVMGLVILGHQWQHERYQNQQLQLQLCSKDEKISHLTYQLAHLKEAVLGRRWMPVLRSSST